MSNTIRNTLIIMIVILALGGCNSFQGSNQSTPTPVPLVTQSVGVVSEGKLVPKQSVQLAFNIPGTVAEVLVQEGDLVQADQVLAHLSQREQYASARANAEFELLNAQQALKTLNENAQVVTAQAQEKVAQARDAVRSAERRVNNLETGSKQTDIDSAAADVVILKDRLDQAQKDFASYENKPEDNLTRAELLSKLADAREKYDNALRLLNNLKGSASDIDLAIATANLSLANAQLDLALQQYEDVKSGPDPDDLAAAEARLRVAETALAAAQEAYADTELKAPFAGTVAKLDLKAGEQVLPGQPAIQLGDFSQWILETNDLTEIDVPKVQVGDEVRITFDALPDLELTGVVDFISSIDEEKFGDVTYTTKIHLVESDPRLRWGMTGVVHIEE